MIGPRLKAFVVKLIAGWIEQSKSLAALLVRDLMMRYGREQLGFVWVVIEPMVLTVGVLVVWSILRGGYDHGVRVIELVFTGYMLLTLWRHLSNNMVLLFRRSFSLLYHRKVSAFDVFYSRVLIEFIGTTTALLFVLVVLTLLGAIGEVEDYSNFIAGWMLMASLATGVGCLILALTESSEASEKLIQPAQYLLIPLSGTFFMVSWLPSRFQDIALLNPLVHCYEIFRAGFFGPSVETHYSVGYVLVWILVLNFLGLSAINRIRHKLQIA